MFHSGSSFNFLEFRVKGKVPDPALQLLQTFFQKNSLYNQSKRGINQLLSLKRDIPLYFLYNYSKKEVKD